MFSNLDVNGDGVLTTADGLTEGQISALDSNGDMVVRIGETSSQQLAGFGAQTAIEKADGSGKRGKTNDEIGGRELRNNSDLSKDDTKFLRAFSADGKKGLSADDLVKLQEDGLITIDADGTISLTDKGLALQSEFDKKSDFNAEDVLSWQDGIDATDTNGDGKLSAEELGVSQEIVDLIDANGDGLLSAYELAAASGGGVDQAQSLFTDLNYFVQSETNGDGVLNGDDTSAWGAGAESYHAEWDSAARGGNGDGVMNFAEYRNYYQENPSG